MRALSGLRHVSSTHAQYVGLCMYRTNYVELCLIPYVYMCVRATSRRRVRAGGTRSFYEHAHYTATEHYSNFTHII